MVSQLIEEVVCRKSVKSVRVDLECEKYTPGSARRGGPCFRLTSRAKQKRLPATETSYILEWNNGKAGGPLENELMESKVPVKAHFRISPHVFLLTPTAELGGDIFTRMPHNNEARCPVSGRTLQRRDVVNVMSES